MHLLLLLLQNTHFTAPAMTPPTFVWLRQVKMLLFMLKNKLLRSSLDYTLKQHLTKDNEHVLCTFDLKWRSIIHLWMPLTHFICTSVFTGATHNFSGVLVNNTITFSFPIPVCYEAFLRQFGWLCNYISIMRKRMSVWHQWQQLLMVRGVGNQSVYLFSSYCQRCHNSFFLIPWYLHLRRFIFSFFN